MKLAKAAAATAIIICFAASVGCDTALASPDHPANSRLLSDPPLTAVVHFADLNVSTAEGVKRLYVRLRVAAAEVCVPLESASAAGASEHRACVAKAIDDAVAGINLPLLSEYHRSQTKGQLRVVKLAEAD
jgi:UrcA family protein